MPTNKHVVNAVLACESQNPGLLVKSVKTLLNNKLVDAINSKKRNLGNKLFESTKVKKEDPYESYEPKIKEAIDYCVESVLDGGLELENTIHMAAKQYNVNEESIHEYFDTFLETTKTETMVASTSSNDEDDKRGLRDDEDTNKRVRYESATLTFKNGQSMIIKEGFWENRIEPVLNQLTPENKSAFLDVITRDKMSFMKAADFCQKVVNQ